MELLIGLVVAVVATVFFVKSRQSKSWSTPAPNSETLYFKRGGTRGMQVTEITVDAQGNAVVSIGKSKESAKTISLNKRQQEELNMLSDLAFAEELEDTYLTGARDLPKTTLRYKGKSVIFHNRNAPESLVNLGRKLREMTSSVE